MMLIITIFAIVISIIIYFISNKEREPVYYLTESIQIFDSKKITASSIRLIDKNSNPIEEDVFVKDYSLE